MWITYETMTTVPTSDMINIWAAMNELWASRTEPWAARTELCMGSMD